MSEKHRIRTDKFAITLLPEEREILSQSAQKYGLSKTEYLRRLILFGGITGQPLLDKEDVQKLTLELSQINSSIKLLSYSLDIGSSLQDQRIAHLETACIRLLSLIGELAYLKQEDRIKWQQQVSMLLHKQ